MHTIIYMDQNYLSYMAKARVGLMDDEAEAKFWTSLFDDLKEAVLSDRVACPELEFHHSETMYDRRLEEPIIKVIEELSWGLKFRHSTNILDSQIYDAAKNFLGKQLEERETWAIAFESDPQAPVESRMTDMWGVKGRISVHFPVPDEVVKHDRQLKRQFVDDTELLKYNHCESGWLDVVQAEKTSFIVSLFGLRAQSTIHQKLHSGSWVDQFVAVSLYGELKKRWQELSEIGIPISDHSAAASFLMSEELQNVPYVDIFCSMHAVMGWHYPNRKQRPSDFYDIPILAIVLPYCDVITTDKFMKEILVKRLDFDNKYKTEIFSATKADRVALQKLVRGLLKT